MVLGDPEGYIEKAKVILEMQSMPFSREVLSSKGFTEFVDTAAIIADMLHVAVYGINPQYSAAAVWKASDSSAKFGLPATLGCVPCPLAEKGD